MEAEDDDAGRGAYNTMLDKSLTTIIAMALAEKVMPIAE